MMPCLFRLLPAAFCFAGCLALSPTSTRAVEAPSPASLPAPAARPVSFAKDIKPLLEASCIKCHAHGQKKGSFQIDSRDLFLKGGESGTSAQAGKSESSLVVRLIAGFDPDRIMPQRGPRLTPEQIGILRAWIDQGLPWDSGVTLGRGAQAPLEPRRPVLPAARGGRKNPVDRFLDAYFAKTKFQWPKAVPDRVFARRAYLDAIGLLPEPADLLAFEKDTRRDKRERLVRRLLSDNQLYAENWMSFWNDALRNDYSGTGFITDNRKQITPWLYAALATNMTFDRFVARLVNPDEHSEGFAKGIVWRGVVNASQTPEVQVAQNISQVFMGINLKCASCHDSFVSDWKLSDAYGLASVYADQPLELVRCDKPQGEIAKRRFLYPQLGEVAESTNRATRLESLAKVITSPKDGRLTRTIVNRLWARFLGRGLVEPVDEMDNPAWDADLLDWLATDLADHQYDLKHTMELILTSQAYQLPAAAADELNQDRFAFRGPLVRRLTAEEYADALSMVTGKWHTLPANLEIDFDVARGASRDSGPPAHWLWESPGAEKAVIPETIYLRKTIALPEVPGEAAAVLTADNRFTLYINGHEAASGDKHSKAYVVDVRRHLRAGENVFAVSAVNDPPSDKDNSPNPAGFIFQARLRSKKTTIPKLARPLAWDFASDASWLCSTNRVDGWEQPDFKAEGWHNAVVLGDTDIAPWTFGSKLLAGWSSAEQYGHVRAALMRNDPLLSALGRPSREQVVTSRAAVATTLQALELTNGSTLAGTLKDGAAALLASPAPAPELATRLYLGGLGRKPTPTELQTAIEMLGEPAKPEGLQDLLWAMSLLPEFQLVY